MRQSLKTIIHEEGYFFAFIFLGISVLLWHFHPFLGKIGLLLTAWCLYFFRDPNRVVPLKKGLIISPADGIVQMIQRVKPPKELGLGMTTLTRISVFMNVFNVHVNRIPIEGTIRKIHYHEGKFFNAELDKASEHNERQLFCVETKDGHKVGFIQIAGLIARRIRCDVKEGKKVKTGERFGLIRFGSRVDVFLPEGVFPLVIVGQKTIAGETVLGDINSKEAARTGEII
ncbi:MAG: phosphatidylserine decarboxylase [Alphaproteobacteria bacterium RIFCSPLOWO2_01_FULL_45_8]|nr:MAG: phosphatidylserine decarboxylase [Alphaproteobacteria bacterium GWB1_45_5]OFW76302.1 MAG: phosphatidylserine decarboxylase [Alphaproteobacteria bacterium GWA1_45_9]OFW89426.1 MAG: phosphatidylserine decarboxylase [Alphaproteobacteria bacterium RIFCSPHIGHO2_01_FULL_41_14]OFW96402.1 MAG: phosphatidylserine decarboxylase [Alphaproteobacteria bacterium RIFCSPLOWO2_01_FULL_45_8]